MFHIKYYNITILYCSMDSDLFNHPEVLTVIVSSPIGNVEECELFRFLWDCIFMSLVTVFGCVGNILTLMVFQQIKAAFATQFLLKSLTCADLLNLIFYRWFHFS